MKFIYAKSGDKEIIVNVDYIIEVESLASDGPYLYNLVYNAIDRIYCCKVESRDLYNLFISTKAPNGELPD